MARKLYGSPFAIVETVLRVRPRIAVGSLRRPLKIAAALGMLGLLAGHFFVFSSCAAAGPLLVPRLDRSAREIFAHLIEARVICRIYTQGRQRITEYCQDGYTCGDDKCLPGPAIRRQIEADKARRLDALKKQQEELERAAKQLQELSQQARRDARRAEAAASSAPSSGGAYQPGSWYTPNGDPGIFHRHDTTAVLVGPYGGQSQRGPRPARNPSIPEKRLTLRRQLRYGFMIADLFKLRDTFSQGGNDWNNADDAIRNLDKKLLDQGIDLKSDGREGYVKSSEVVNDEQRQLLSQRAVLVRTAVDYYQKNNGPLQDFAGIYDGLKDCKSDDSRLNDAIMREMIFAGLMVKQLIWFEGDTMVSVRFLNPHKPLRGRLTFWRDFELAEGGAIKLYQIRYENGNSERIGFYRDMLIIDPKITGNSINYQYAKRCSQETAMIEWAKRIYDVELAAKGD